jgi:hypothetical protein
MPGQVRGARSWPGGSQLVDQLLDEPMVTVVVLVTPPRTKVMVTLSPAVCDRTVAMRVSESVTTVLSILVITSPCFSPAAAPGPPAVTASTVTLVCPVVWLVLSPTEMPIWACVALPVVISSWAMVFARLIGIAKPTPMLPDWLSLLLLSPSDAMALLMPMTLPLASTSAPPEFPGLIAASV